MLNGLEGLLKISGKTQRDLEILVFYRFNFILIPYFVSFGSLAADFAQRLFLQNTHNKFTHASPSQYVLHGAVNIRGVAGRG